MQYVVLTALIAISLLTPTRAADVSLHGRILDEHGKPVAGVAIDNWWSANGTLRQVDGTIIDVKSVAGEQAFRGDIGKMEPKRFPPAESAADGSFELKVPDYALAVLAFDRQRERGALIAVSREVRRDALVVPLTKVVRVRGSLVTPDGQRPHWSYVHIALPEDPLRPLASTRIVACGSFESRFEMRLPPGRYFFEASGGTTDMDDEDLLLQPQMELTLTTDRCDVDLGTLKMQPHVSREKRLEKRRQLANAAGNWTNYQDHYGDIVPEWHITQARGIAQTTKLADLRGKWVVLYVWQPSCRPCISSGLPKLMDFFDTHASHRDRFELIAFCISIDNEFPSMKEIDEPLARFSKLVWKGRTPQFPVVVDNTMQTWDRLGLWGWGNLLLIDPEGRLVKGNLKTLSETLNQP